MSLDNLQMLARAADHLSSMLNEVVFLGGATIQLWITDPAAPPMRVTADVDMIVEISTRRDYYRLERRVRKMGFDNDPSMICRFRHRRTHLLVDLMPTEAGILGFKNRWQSEAFNHAVEVALPEEQTIRAIPPPFLLATKMEAFANRGNYDFYGSRDFEDLVRVIDGREELSAELAGAPNGVREYVREQLRMLSLMEDFDNGLEGALPASPESRERVDSVIWPRILEMKGGVDIEGVDQAGTGTCPAAKVSRS
jgi:hypothetical protein